MDIDELQAAADAATAREDAAFEALVLEKEQSGRIARGASFLTAKFALQSDPRFKAAKRRAEAAVQGVRRAAEERGGGGGARGGGGGGGGVGGRGGRGAGGDSVRVRRDVHGTTTKKKHRTPNVLSVDDEADSGPE